MNDRKKHKQATGQISHQPADTKVKSSLFLFLPGVYSDSIGTHFLKTIIASRTKGTFGFAQYTSRPFAKPKEPFFGYASLKILNLKTI